MRKDGQMRGDLVTAEDCGIRAAFPLNGAVNGDARKRALQRPPPPRVVGRGRPFAAGCYQEPVRADRSYIKEAENENNLSWKEFKCLYPSDALWFSCWFWWPLRQRRL